MSDDAAVMPDFCAPRRGVRQTIDSAIPSLERLGIEPGQIVLRSAGAGWLPGTVVAQEPAPGTPLGEQTRIVLDVAGTGSLESVPFALREDSDDDMRVDALFALFDNPLRKLSYTVRRGGGFLQLHPDDPTGALRWVEGIFRVPARPWAKRRWYAMARLLPALHRVAGRADAVPLALQLVFGLPVRRVRLIAGLVPMHEDRQTRLGVANGRLGVDAAIGRGRLASTAVEVTIGPVTLDRYRECQVAGERAEREAIYRLVLPAHMHRAVTERWAVGDPGEPARLRDSWQPAALGLNSFLGGVEQGAAT
jgi:type VI secretion system (T6SS) VasB/ImpH family protein/PASTA domain-containing protein